MLDKNELLRQCCEIYHKAWIPTESKCDKLIFPSFEVRSEPQDFSLHPAISQNEIAKRVQQADQEVAKLLEENDFNSWPEDEQSKFMYQLSYSAV